MFEFKITSRSSTSHARTGEFHTPHGTLQTPALATVATDGMIRHMPKGIMKELPLPYAIVNTFHILTKNILEKIRPGTVHNYGNFPGVIASDSGGFQVFSLGFGKQHRVGKLQTPSTRSNNHHPEQHEGSTRENTDANNPLLITEEGVTFDWNFTSTNNAENQSISNTVSLTPERSMEIQHQIGADMIFAFDECTSPFNSREYVAASVEKTHRWLKRCVAHHKELSMPDTKQQALMGIVQGGQWEDLRIKSAKLCASVDVPGFGIGGSFGSSFGDSKKNMHQILEWIMPHLPDEKPRHLLGIGQVDDLFECVERGVDLFDCVIPTREARHKVFYTKKGKVELKRIKTSNDPIALDCNCIACTQKITGVQLYELFMQKDPRAFIFATAHNIQFFADLMEEIREAIQKKSLSDLKEAYLSVYQ